MPHARTLTAAADPIHAAIERHRAAYDAFQVAPEGDASMVANDDYDHATDALVATPCASRFGALALLAHLRWWLADEAEFSAGHQPGYSIAQARVADLTLFLGIHLPKVACAVPPLLPARAFRGMRAAAETLAALAIICGGTVLVGLASII